MPNGIHALIKKPNEMQVFVAGIPRVGAKTAFKMGRYFKSPDALMAASPRELRKSGLGKQDSQTVWKWLRGGGR
jgi:hypothetical protein